MRLFALTGLLLSSTLASNYWNEPKSFNTTFYRGFFDSFPGSNTKPEEVSVDTYTSDPGEFLIYDSNTKCLINEKNDN